jgi:hypothetical protein
MGYDSMVLPHRAAAVALLLLPLPALAEPPVPAAETDEAEVPSPGDIVVVAERIRGGVDTPLPPIVTLGEEDIAAYGAGSLQSLLAALAPQIDALDGLLRRMRSRWGTADGAAAASAEAEGAAAQDAAALAEALAEALVGALAAALVAGPAWCGAS